MASVFLLGHKKNLKCAGCWTTYFFVAPFINSKFLLIFQKWKSGKLLNLPIWTIDFFLYVLLGIFQYVRDILQVTVLIDHPVLDSQGSIHSMYSCHQSGTCVWRDTHRRQSHIVCSDLLFILTDQGHIAEIIQVLHPILDTRISVLCPSVRPSVCHAQGILLDPSLSSLKFT